MRARPGRLARALLKRYKISEPPVPDSLVEAAPGVQVKLTHLPVGAAGTLFREPPFGSIIWLEGSFNRRRRFALFHHIGHLLMHPETLYCSLLDSSEAPAESEADAFAAEILMPEEWLRRDAAVAGVKELAERYMVTRRRMRTRLRELGLSRGTEDD